MVSISTASPSPTHISLPDIPVVCINGIEAAILTTDGEIKTLPHTQAQKIIHGQSVMVCHAPYTEKQIGAEINGAFDVLELFAFVHPAKFCVPTVTGLAKALGITPPSDFESQPMTLMECANALLSDLKRDQWQAKAPPLPIASVMGAQGKGWCWTPFIFSSLGEQYDPRIPVISKSDLNIWKNLPEWSEEAPPPPPDHFPVTGEEARLRLKELLGNNAETRQAQKEYTTLLTSAFLPKDDEDEPHVVLAEAGTGVGKTLGYLAPASVWSEKNKGTVWVSTYTKNLQRQVDQELERLYPDEQLKESKVAIRKGRENYLCLLNFEESATGASLSRDPRQAIALGLMARWLTATKDGDLMSGRDFPGWLSGLLGFKYTYGLSDTRGECIYSSCDHYHRCFVEQSLRRAKYANIVVANHALVMIQAAISPDGSDIPKRLVFDEGHHIFDAADSAFAGHLTARETYDLRRWIRGAESSGKTRLRGLKSRAEDLIAGNAEDEKLLQDILAAAGNLTGDGWRKRLNNKEPKGVCETFIAAVYEQVLARTETPRSPYSIETGTFPITDNVKEAIPKLKSALVDLKKPMTALANSLNKTINDQADTLNTDTKKRMEAVASGLHRRSEMTLSAWIAMLETLEQGHLVNDFTDWMEVERLDGKSTDVGLYRHWINPVIPFTQAIKPYSHGITITSATLNDKSDEDWQSAADKTGAMLLNKDPQTARFSSPFDYAAQTKILVIQDVRKDNLEQVSSAYRSLFTASGGGGIGLFTAISRLKSVHEKIKAPLEENNIPLYAQHMDEMDTGTLVDIFRDEENSCLLGTDAIRDGIDVPGRSMRLMVFDRVPWPRPTILHKARRDYFGGRQYDDKITRFKLKQAYGRLIRRSEDRGVFVMLDSMIPSRLHDAFPPGVAIEKVGLSDACKIIEGFLS